MILLYIALAALKILVTLIVIGGIASIIRALREPK